MSSTDVIQGRSEARGTRSRARIRGFERESTNRLVRLGFAMLASLPLLVALGCGEGTTIEVSGAECRERCVDGRIYDLSSIDHEQPSGAAIEAIDRSCRETSEPCCFHVGADPFSGKVNGFVTCLPSRESAE